MSSHSDSKGILLESKLSKIFNKRDGIFIELGANDGIFQSNTFLLEKKLGWRGILIEPSFKGYKLCVKNRPNSLCLNYACVSNDYIDEFVSGDFGDNNPMASVNGIRKGRGSSCVKVKAITLEKILDEYNYEHIDFLSLDTEGYELNILKGLNLDKYRPRYMLIEI